VRSEERRGVMEGERGGEERRGEERRGERREERGETGRGIITSRPT